MAGFLVVPYLGRDLASHQLNTAADCCLSNANRLVCQQAAHFAAHSRHRRFKSATNQISRLVRVEYKLGQACQLGGLRTTFETSTHVSSKQDFQLNRRDQKASVQSIVIGEKVVPPVRRCSPARVCGFSKRRKGLIDEGFVLNWALYHRASARAYRSLLL